MTDRPRHTLVLAACLLATAAAGAQGEGQVDDPSALRSLRDAMEQAEDFSAALEPAERVAELAADPMSATAISDLLHLARVQAELELHEEAELNYFEAIDRLRETQGAFSPSLVPAYRGLGRTYINLRDFRAAIPVLEQARQVSRRNVGLFNVEQSGLLDDMTLAYIGLGDTSEARRLQHARLENALRQYGEDDPRVVPFRHHLADYYDRSRLRLSAREQYVLSLDVLERSHGELDPRLLPTLRELLRIDLALGKTGDAPERIRLILEAAEADLSAAERSESLAALADEALVRGATDEAEAYYSAAYGALAEERPAAAAAAFAAPRMLDFVAPLSAVDRARRNRQHGWGTVDLEFDVTASGRAVNVRAVRVEPALSIGRDFVRRVRETHFRPRLVRGVAAETRNVRFSHDFRYYVEPDGD